MSQVSGNVLPISYQGDLAKTFRSLISSDSASYAAWLTLNGLDPNDQVTHEMYSLSNLYVPKIFVERDRLHLNVPRVQFWVSFMPEMGTREFLESQLLFKQFSIGDSKSSVSFMVQSISDISPIKYYGTMEYQTLSPIVIMAMRANNTLEFLRPGNPFFAQFLVDDLIERWERYYRCPYTGNRNFYFSLLQPERRKAININDEMGPQMVVSYMMKFQLSLDPQLQQFAYVCGLGDKTESGFGFIELLKKKR